MGPAKFIIFFDVAGKWRFRLVAPNEEPIAASEGYNSKQACINGIEAVRKYAPIAIIVDNTK